LEMCPEPCDNSIGDRGEEGGKGQQGVSVSRNRGSGCNRRKKVLSPKATAAELHSLHSSQANKDPHFRVADGGVRGKEEPDTGLGRGGAESRGECVPESKGHRAVPKGMAPAIKVQNRATARA
jgi:hypothetical protein